MPSHANVCCSVDVYETICTKPHMDPGEYVLTPDGEHMVVLHSGVDPRAARVWDVVLDAFRDMGASRTSLRADAWRLQHDSAFHHEWAILLPIWCPSLAYYATTTRDDAAQTPGSQDERS